MDAGAVIVIGLRSGNPPLTKKTDAPVKCAPQGDGRISEGKALTEATITVAPAPRASCAA
jgi:hypothetical protein